MADLLPVPTEETQPQSNPLGFHPVAFGVERLRTIFVNLYAVETSDGGFVLVDTGMAGTAALVKSAMAARFGKEARPRAILMTHAHVDHIGNAKALAEEYDVPVYVHPLEKPYVTGDGDYAPADPTPGGAIAFFARFMPTRGTDLGSRVRTLPEDGSVPELAGWRWVATPGHTPGHVSFFREADRVLVAGDAFTTADMDDWIDMNLWPQELSRPPTPFTPDWETARASVLALADLDPSLVAPGHGHAMQEVDLAGALRSLAERVVAPEGGRYAESPARYDAEGRVVSVPSPKSDPLPKKLLLAGAIAFAAAIFLKRRR